MCECAFLVPRETRGGVTEGLWTALWELGSKPGPPARATSKPLSQLWSSSGSISWTWFLGLLIHLWSCLLVHSIPVVHWRESPFQPSLSNSWLHSDKWKNPSVWAKWRQKLPLSQEAKGESSVTMQVVQMGTDNSYSLLGPSYMNILPSQSSSQEPRSQLVMRRQILLRNASLGNNLRQQKGPDSWYRGQNWTNIIISSHSHLQVSFKDRVSKRIREWCHVSCLLGIYPPCFMSAELFLRFIHSLSSLLSSGKRR